jgi:RNA polymerase sigma-70 factor (ECF subfamily)
MACTANTATGALPALPAGRRVTYARVMPDRLEDSALMLRYRDGDVAAFEALYRRHKDSVYRYLLRMSRDEQVAEDVVQDAWSKIIRARDQYRPTARFSTYLFRVAHNCFIDYVRRNRRHEHGEELDADSTPASGDAPETETERLLARERLDIALRQLPDEQRDVFLLREEAGLSLDEIALVTNTNRETAKSRLRYAIGKLRIAIADRETPPATRRHHDD